ncbi:MAG TPA: MFS transporter [Blastocatellia bacterium]|nr:MFS transporter [Blastocatellia bacterium]
MLKNNRPPGEIRERLGLERNVVVMSLSVFVVGAGEELWVRFIPKYLEALGASPAWIGLFGTADDFLDAVYQYPGGYFSDRFGSGRSLVLFGSVAVLGYAIYALSWTWWPVFVGLIFVSAWSSMGSPAIFALIADRLPSNRRAMGFTVQSLLKRIPIMISPAVGGLLIAHLGLFRGLRAALVVTMILASAALLAQRRLYSASSVQLPHSPLNVSAQFRYMHSSLKRLLLSDVFVRTCEGMTGVFIVLYAINIARVSPAQFGLLVTVQMGTSIAAYFPGAWLAGRYGRKPLVIATFICFAAFPLAIVVSPHGFNQLCPAFFLGGLREIGEPARKALIVDLSDPERRGRTVGLYYLLRSLSITPAAAIGGLLWKLDPSVPFFTASAIGLLGTTIFAAMVDADEPKASQQAV